MEEVKYITGDLVRVEDSANWWTEDGTIMKISAVNCTDMVDVLCGSENYTVDIDDIVPIPLTTKILKLNGWYQDVENKWVYPNDYPNADIRLEHNRDWLIWINNENTLVYIKFAHELQHLLFGFGLDHNLKV